MLNDDFMCSPKSMYRLADKYGLDKVKELSAEAIHARITSDNVLPELFSSITAT